MTMTDIVPLARSAGVKNPALKLFQVPPTDLSMMSYRMVPIHPFTTGINPIDFQIDPQEDYVDLSHSYFKIELSLKKAGGGNVVAAENTFLVNNIAHSLFKHQRSTQQHSHQSTDRHVSLQSLLGDC